VLPAKILLLKNNSLAEVVFEQRELGNPDFGCDLAPIDFAGYARTCGAPGFACAQPEDLRATITEALQTPGPVLIEVTVDARASRKTR
jgi:pyruvate dehydrogenase (quinone)